MSLFPLARLLPVPGWTETPRERLAGQKWGLQSRVQKAGAGRQTWDPKPRVIYWPM